MDATRSDRSPRGGPTGHEPWLALTLAGRRAEVVRTAEPYERIEDVERSYRALVDRLERAGGLDSILIDLRSAPGRNDPAFERVIAPLRRRMFETAERRALIVRTAIGRLQVKRHAADDGVDLEVFLDPDEARAWLDRPA